ncbi:TPA: phage tail protein I [Escherichia coli]|nr:phage tail protein I [Escherichia coli]EEZ8615095.1 phage tail protein I [Escherichia coli O160]ARA20088.1 phage tail protein I [Escherichia coli]ARW92657.1 phage tail protein I [Escherichia coli]ARX56448.1 phage tail protein I [Escherichia coli]
MNLVMSDITRNKLGCYMAQQASLNNIPVSALVSRFTVEPSVQQRFENAVKESTEFTKKINVFGVTDQKGEKILLDTTGPIARTNTSYDGTKRRNPNNVVDLKNRKYQCEQVNYDTFISYPQLDAWAAHPDFQSRVSTQIARQVALDRIMIGFNGTSHADESNFSTNKLLQDVTDIPVDLNTLWSPDTCPVHLLPYLAWAFSVDRWDRNWPEETKRQVIRDAWLIHRHKGTISALRRAIEPLGYLIRVSEWWEFGGEPGTFTVEVGTLDSGVTEEMYLEMERLIADARPVSRHMTGLNIIQEIPGDIFAAAATYDGEVITIYPDD